MTIRQTAIYKAKAAFAHFQMRGAMINGLARVELDGETRFSFTHDGYTVILRANCAIGGAVDATATKRANTKPAAAPVAEAEAAAPVAEAEAAAPVAEAEAAAPAYPALDAIAAAVAEGDHARAAAIAEGLDDSAEWYAVKAAYPALAEAEALRFAEAEAQARLESCLVIAPSAAPVADAAAPAFIVPHDHESLVQAAIDFDFGGISHEEARALVATSGTQANMIHRAFAAYNRALSSPSAARAGIIGVGLITYANARLARFSARVALVQGGRA